jgi:hypothetical protein
MGLKKFPPNLMAPAPGTLQGLIFGDPAEAGLSCFFHEIRIPIQPFTLNGKQVETGFDLNFVQFGKHLWGDLDGRTFHFKKNPEEPYVDGCLPLGGVFNPVDAPFIKIGQRAGLKIPVEVEVAIAFEYEGGGFLDTELKLRAMLTYEGVRIDGNLLPGTPKNTKRAKALASQVIDLTGYQEPEIIDTSVTGEPFPCFIFRPK